MIGGYLTATAEDLEDRQVPFAPDDTLTGSVTWLFDMGGWSGNATAAARYSSSYDFTAGAGGELRASAQDDLVITSYSIHYTKLYEARSSPRASRRPVSRRSTASRSGQALGQRRPSSLAVTSQRLRARRRWRWNGVLLPVVEPR